MLNSFTGWWICEMAMLKETGLLSTDTRLLTACNPMVGKNPSSCELGWGMSRMRLMFLRGKDRGVGEIFYRSVLSRGLFWVLFTLSTRLTQWLR